MTLAFPVSFRLVTDADMGFVAKGWIQSYHDGTRGLRAVPFHRYKREQRALIRDAVERGKCIVACDPADLATLYGFACGWDDIGVGVLHYVYVISTRQRMGLGRALVHELGRECARTMKVYTHHTDVCDHVVRAKEPRAPGLPPLRAGFMRALGIQHDPNGHHLVRMIYASDGTVRGQSAPGGPLGESTPHAHQGGRAGGPRPGDAA